MDHAARLERAHSLARRLRRHYGERVLAIGAYGSLARGTDRPYSDIEMHCVLRGTQYERWLEWSAGPWKAEIDVYSQDLLLARAAGVDGDWPVSHGAVTAVLPLYDPEGYFPRLEAAVYSQPDAVFLRVMREVIVGDIYERIGKIRNAHADGHAAPLPALAVDLARDGARLIGLDNRHLYTSGSRLWEESLSLPNRPDGYDALLRLVTAGTLHPPDRVAGAADAFWAGVERWAAARGLMIEEDLEALLAAAGTL
jgi:kanamycin nucleotidyltransferase